MIYNFNFMTYKFRISLPGLKGFARIYEVGSKNTLYQFSKQMVSDMEFPVDQVVLFKAFDAAGNLLAKYATFDLGDGSIERITIEALVKNGVTEMTYFYDTIYKRSVIITFEGEAANEVTLPTLTELKGPNPEAFLNGYVAFEDLPAEKQRRLANPDDEDFDDDDLDDEDEEEEDDEEEEIYGEDGDDE